MTSLPCGVYCNCYYNQSGKANVFNCSGQQVTKLPSDAPRFTNWIEITQSSVTKLCGSYPYFLQGAVNVTSLSLRKSRVSYVCDSTLNFILKHSHITWLDLSNNELRNISPLFRAPHNHLEKLWLAGNPIQCDCSMIWLIDWISNAVAHSGERLVQDYQSITCGPGQQAGTPIYKLNRVEMGCFPKHLPAETVTILSIFGGFVLLCLIVIILVYKNRVLVRWLLYKHFGKLIGLDGNENLDNMLYDAFLSYW